VPLNPEMIDDKMSVMVKIMARNIARSMIPKRGERHINLKKFKL
jgi:hypothetical protein